MKELVEVIAKALVDHPEEVSVNEKQEGRTTVLELSVSGSLPLSFSHTGVFQRIE